MSTINELKEQQILETPLLLFECTLAPGEVERWSTHKVVAGGDEYKARVLQHNVFDLSLHHDEGIDSVATVSVTLANADGHFSQIARNQGWKGARLAVRFVFYNLKDGEASSELTTIFRGVANPPDVITETTLRLTFNNRLNLHRVLLPQVRIQKRCPWVFPCSAAQREEALHGGTKGKYSLLYRCGYSAGAVGGAGNLEGGAPFTGCDFTRAQCEARGMFDQDGSNGVTRRFGGIEFAPPSITVRSAGEKGPHLSTVAENEDGSLTL